MTEILQNDVGGYYDSIIQTDDSGNTYIAEAPLGTPRPSTAWRVKRISQTDGETQIVWAENHPGFIHTATDLTALTFREI